MTHTELRRLLILVAIARPFAFAPCVQNAISAALEPCADWSRINTAVEAVIEEVPGLYLRLRLQAWLDNGKEAAKAA